jgi:hypothetical protein
MKQSHVTVTLILIKTLAASDNNNGSRSQGRIGVLQSNSLIVWKYTEMIVIVKRAT